MTKQNIENFALELLEKCKKLGATSADVLVAESDDISVSCRMGKPENIERAESSGFGLRVFIGNQSATISSSKFSDATELTERCIAMAKEAPSDEFSELASASMLAKKIPDLELCDSYEPSAIELRDLAIAIENAALEEKLITNSDGGQAGFTSYKTILATSNGFFGSYKSSYSGISVSVLAGSGHDMQTDYDYSSARFFADLKPASIIGKNAARRTVRKLNPKKIPSGKYPVIFEPRVSRGFLGDLATGINGSSVARGTSYLKNKLGEKLFCSEINIIDNPHIIRGLASKPFDAEGVANKKTLLVENGVLNSWVLDIRSANQLGLITTGHASRGVGGNPSPSTTNLYMENGKQSPAEIIKSIKRGIFVTDTFGMGINYTTGDYSQGASGFFIENGEITFPIAEITLAGNLVDIFMNIIPANDLEFLSSTNAPTILVTEMTVAGT